MKFLLANEHLDTQITKIKRLIKLSMNGVAADSMRQHGLIYKQNYGVAIPRLREIAAELPRNHDLAQRLWLLKIRETMILATMMQPPATLNMEQALAWLDDCTTTELIEQINLNLFRHLDYAPELVMHCISSATISRKIAGYILALRIAEKIPTNLQHQIVLKAIEDANIDDIPLANSIGNCLARFCRKDATTGGKIFKSVEHFNSDCLNGKKLIYDSVKHELIFLGLLNEKF